MKAPPKREPGRPKADVTMTVAVRLPSEFLDRAQALIPALRKTELGAATNWSGASVLRLAVHHGLSALEESILKAAQNTGGK